MISHLEDLLKVAKVKPMVNQASGAPRPASGTSDNLLDPAYYYMIDEWRRTLGLRAEENSAMGCFDKEADVISRCSQLEWHPMCWIPEMIPFAKKHNIVLQAYSSLGSGHDKLVEHPVVKEVKCPSLFKKKVQGFPFSIRAPEPLSPIVRHVYGLFLCR